MTERVAAAELTFNEARVAWFLAVQAHGAELHAEASRQYHDASAGAAAYVTGLVDELRTIAMLPKLHRHRVEMLDQIMIGHAPNGWWTVHGTPDRWPGTAGRSVSFAELEQQLVTLATYLSN